MQELQTDSFQRTFKSFSSTVRMPPNRTTPNYERKAFLMYWKPDDQEQHSWIWIDSQLKMSRWLMRQSLKCLLTGLGLDDNKHQGFIELRHKQSDKNNLGLTPMHKTTIYKLVQSRGILWRYSMPGCLKAHLSKSEMTQTNNQAGALDCCWQKKEERGEVEAEKRNWRVKNIGLQIGVRLAWSDMRVDVWSFWRALDTYDDEHANQQN